MNTDPISHFHALEQAQVEVGHRHGFCEGKMLARAEGAPAAACEWSWGQWELGSVFIFFPP
jgi:hypothetical protein